MTIVLFRMLGVVLKQVCCLITALLILCSTRYCIAQTQGQLLDCTAIVTIDGQGNDEPVSGLVGVTPGGSVTLKAVGYNLTSYRWYRDGDILPGAIGQSFAVTQPGSYEVQGYRNGGYTTSPRVRVVSTPSAAGHVLSYSQVTSIDKAGITVSSQIEGLTIGDKQQSVSYYDGLGRVLESIQKERNANQQDIFSFQEYDAAGVTPTRYLPYATSPTSNTFKPLGTLEYEQAQFYQNTDKVATEQNPVAVTTFEDSPMHRSQQAGRIGDAALAHPRSVSYESNSEADEVHQWVVNPTTLDGTALYEAGSLNKVISTDEEGHVVITFTNELGQTVLQRKIGSTNAGKPGEPEPPSTIAPMLDTYTLYDAIGHVTCIIPPLAVEGLANTQWQTRDADFFKRWLYQYTYDERGRLSSRQVPGPVLTNHPTYFVYDRFDRLVLLQDANRSANNSWYFTKYDRQGRVVLEGLYYSSKTQDELQRQADGWASNNAGEEQLPNRYGEYSTNQSFPVVTEGTNANFLSLTVYDSYDLDGDGSLDYSYSPLNLEAELEPVPDYHAFGRPILTRRRIINSDGDIGDWLITVPFYDQYGNLIQQLTNSELNLDVGSNITTMVYGQGGFRSQLVQCRRAQNTDQFDAVEVRNRFEYDHAGRMLKVWQQNYRGRETDAEVLVADYAYNALGQLVEKNLHSLDGGLSFLQSVDLRYDSSGQLTHFNNSELTADGVTNDDINDVFGFTLNRQEGADEIKEGAKPRFDGGISAIRWQVANPLQQNQPQRERAYTFNYDALGRLSGAKYIARDLKAATFAEEEDAYNEDNIRYDSNGNIRRLTRRTQPDADPTTAFEMDNLQYKYNGNVLQSVDDNASSARGFRDGVQNGIEYTYDANGNVTNDNNKSIRYAYNQLNKVAKQRTPDGEISYDYDAAGTVLHQTVENLRTQQRATYYYVEGVVYEQSARLTGLASVPSPEGRVLMVTEPAPKLPVATLGGEGGIKGEEPLPDKERAKREPESVGAPRFVYEYHLRDHQNNLRVAFRAETGQRIIYLTMEDNAREEGRSPLFQNVTRTRSSDNAYEGSMSAAVTASNQGPKTTVAVQDGDVVKLDFFYLTPSGVQYLRPTAPTPSTASTAVAMRILPLLVPGSGSSSTPRTEQGSPKQTTSWQAGVQLSISGLLSRPTKRVIPFGNGQPPVEQIDSQLPPTTPGGGPVAPAYVSWRLLAGNGDVIKSGTAELPVPTRIEWQHFSTSIAVDATGQDTRTARLEVQLLNDGSRPVYIDSLTLRHPLPALFISQENHYYPFGMNLSGVAVNTLPAEMSSKRQYNGGSELEDAVLDVEGANYSTSYRRYDATIGRFLGIDPLADIYADQSPFHFAGNDPVNGQDPTGALTFKNGAYVPSPDRGPISFGFNKPFAFVGDTDGSGSPVGPGLSHSEGDLGYSKWAELAREYVEKQKDADFFESAKEMLIDNGLGFTRNGVFGYYTDAGWVGETLNQSSELAEVGVGVKFRPLLAMSVGEYFDMPKLLSMGMGFDGAADVALGTAALQAERAGQTLSLTTKVVGRSIGAVGGALAIGNSYLEYKQQKADTHTYVNAALGAVGIGLLFVTSTALAPVVVTVGAGIFIYGILNSGGAIDNIVDDASGHIGKTWAYDR